MTNEKGFSLLETALLLLIVGIIAGPMLEAYNLYVKERNTSKTYAAGSTIQNAITEFYELHDRYPCPAIPELAVGDPLHGIEQCPGRDMDGDTTIMAAMVMESCVTGYCRVSGRDADGDSADDGVLIGNIPYVTLGVPYNEALDGWKHRFTYAVTETMTDSATFIPTRGAIMVWKADGSTPLSFGDPANPNANPKHQNGQGTAHFVYFSHGQNGRGSYSIEGIRIGENCDNGVFTAAEVAAAGKDYNEIENCDNDYEFTWDSEAYSTQQGYDYYDDIFYFQDGLPSGGTWNYSGVQEDVFTSFGGNLGIGTADPQFAVDVNGNIRAASLTRTTGYCDETGNNCMEAQVIGGSGMSCSGSPMAGIELNDGVCEVELPAGSISGECSSGEYVTGIDGSGNVICEPVS
ncbi:MAG: hypothetical protein IPH06_07585 [Alphaproteobacteria bacterium]|nr:hypothetical protein [Alphaproteobacteria bacterium]QQS57870.1 MAG: hypothetical protein IPN28_03345 [Alphaproteobacteria bacterium]